MGLKILRLGRSGGEPTAVRLVPAWLSAVQHIRAPSGQPDAPGCRQSYHSYSAFISPRACVIIEAGGGENEGAAHQRPGWHKPSGRRGRGDQRWRRLQLQLQPGIHHSPRCGLGEYVCSDGMECSVSVPRRDGANSWRVTARGQRPNVVQPNVVQPNVVQHRVQAKEERQSKVHESN